MDLRECMDFFLSISKVQLNNVRLLQVQLNSLHKELVLLLFYYFFFLKSTFVLFFKET